MLEDGEFAISFGRDPGVLIIAAMFGLLCSPVPFSIPKPVVLFVILDTRIKMNAIKLTYY